MSFFFYTEEAKGPGGTRCARNEGIIQSHPRVEVLKSYSFLEHISVKMRAPFSQIKAAKAKIKAKGVLQTERCIIL